MASTAERGSAAPGCEHPEGGHHHHHHGPGAHGSTPARRLAIVLVLTGVYMVAELVGGVLTNSLALLSDAGHMFADVAAIALSLTAIWFGSRPAPPHKTYGYYRLEILAALFNGATLVAISGFIVWEAIERLEAPPVVASAEMIAIAAGGLAVNLVSAWILHAHDDHGPRTLNEHGAYLHVLGDALGSAGALAAGVAMWAWGWYAADPIFSILIAVLIVVSSFALLREAVNVLLEGTPSHLNIATVKQNILAIDGVIDVHDLHVWTITSGKDALSAHIVCDEATYSKDYLETVRRRLHAELGISHLTIQLETPEFDEDECHF
jgi:cobalt-zinc-cadmium efflux system protein